MKATVQIFLTFIFLTLGNLGFAEETPITNPEASKILVEQAYKAFEKEDFPLAIIKFEAAYKQNPVPNILYNIARIHEKQASYKKAIEYYKEFILAPGIEQGPRQDALDRIKSLEETLKLTAPKVKVEKKKASVMPFVLMGSGIAVLAGSGAFAFLAKNKHDEFSREKDLESKRQLADEGKTLALVADGLLVTGSIVTLVGAVIWMASSDDEEVSTTAISPTFDGQKVGFDLTMRY